MDLNRELMILIKKYGLTSTNVAQMTGSSVDTVKAWRVRSDSDKFRNMPERAIKLLKYEIRDRNLCQRKKGKGKESYDLKTEISGELYRELTRYAEYHSITIEELVINSLRDKLGMDTDDPYLSAAKRRLQARDRFLLRNGVLAQKDIKLIPREMIKQAKVEFKDVEFD